MGFTDLPKELLQAILNHAITVRGIKRGLRLRLVNKRFAAEVIDTIYTHRMLDRRFSQRLSPSQRPPMPPFTASYIEYRVHNSEDSSVLYPRLGFLRRISRDVVAENVSLLYDDCVRLLCRLISEGGAAHVYQVFCPALSLPTAFYQGDEYYIDNLFAAAVVTNTTPIVERYIDIYQDRSFRPVLGTDSHELYRLAARYASPETLEIILSGGRSHGVHIQRRNDMLVAAAAVGRPPAFRFVHEFRIDEIPWDFKDRTKRYASEKVFNDALITPSKEVWDILMELRARYKCPEVSEDRKQIILAECINEGGDVALVKHLLDLWPDIAANNGLGDRVSVRPPRFLLDACANGYEDLVRFLLSRGVNTDSAVIIAAAHGQTSIVRLLLDHGAAPFGGLLRAARGGYMDIAKMLLDAGVHPGETDGRPLLYPGLGNPGLSDVPIASAMAIEHVEMATLLKEKGAEVNGHAALECLRATRKEGLESMLSLIYKWHCHQI
ncbi:ankyrin [Karstenula rhodostoma CBS 690.94]|uniref:Ankyrin n=1 Tax=Karstenula rhodostoma CBS 690.94 TaxID=1392251 RepID=A0A9P4P4E8_9PLEO|nr:ankyrin [Karstenula rhodostoma CBS 690.94]